MMYYMTFLRKKMVGILPFLLVVIGLWLSLSETFKIWYLDSDISAIFLVIEALQQEGWGILKSFHFPLDNWLGSVILPDLIWSYFFGNSPSSIFMTGVVVFWLTAIVSGGIVVYVSGVKKGVWATGFILCAPQGVLGGWGYLTYPAAHNVSVLWGFLGLFCALVWIKEKRFIAILGAVFFLSVAGFSDPWVLSAFDLPLICAAVMTCLFKGKENAFLGRKNLYWVILNAVVVAIILSKTSFLGIFHIASDNMNYFLKIRFSLKTLPNILGAMACYFNVVPGVNFLCVKEFILAQRWGALAGLFGAAFFDVIVLFSFLYFAVLHFFRKMSSFDDRKVFLSFFLLFSIMGIASSVFVFGLVKDISSSRYFVNIYYCVIMFLFIHNVNEKYEWINGVRGVFGFLWILSSLISNLSGFSFKAPFVTLPNESVLSVLKDEQIDTAFGNYFGVEANSLTWLAHGQAHVRPVLYDPDYHGFLPSIWSSSSWYRLPAHKRWALVITSTEGNDVCSPFPTCEDAAIHQFGMPLNVLHVDRMIFMIYSSDTATIPYNGTVNTWTIPLPLPDEGKFLGWQDFYPNNHMNRDALVTLQGWGDIKKGKIASITTRATVGIPVSDTEHHLMKARFVLGSSTFTRREVDVEYKGRVIAQWRLGRTETVQSVEFPVEKGQRFVSCDLVILNPEKGQHGGMQGVTLSEVQVVNAS